jgi:GxxExxY protein
VTFEPIGTELEQIGKDIVDAAIKIHRQFGPGLLESVYKICLAQELANRGHAVQLEVPIPVVFEGIKLECGFRMDMLVDGKVVVELKAVDVLPPVWEAQILTYLKLSGRRLGFLLNFNVALMKDGIYRRVI